jgi:MFS family permease
VSSAPYSPRQVTDKTDTGGYIDNPTQKGWLTSILELGAWVGTLLSGFIAEVASRKYGILIASSVFILGVVVQACSIVGGHEEILAGRFITFVTPVLLQELPT